MTEAKGEKQQAFGRSSTFWIIASFGAAILFVSVFVCGLVLSIGGFWAFQTLTTNSLASTQTDMLEDQEAASTETITEPEGEATEASSDEGEPSIIGIVSADAPAPKLGNPAADFALEDLDGNIVSLSDFEGQPVIINFWATWCGPCEAEMPDINNAYLKHKADGLVILAVDMAEHPDTVRSFVDYHKLAFAILIDKEQDVGRYYGARALPTTFFVDPSGTIVHVFYGAMTARDIEVGLRKILPDKESRR